MKLGLAMLYLMAFCGYGDVGLCSASESDYVLLPPLYFSHGDTLSVPPELKGIMLMRLSFCPYNAINFLCLHYLFILKDWFNISENYLAGFVNSLLSKTERSMLSISARHRLMIILLLLISGNVQPNPGPDMPDKDICIDGFNVYQADCPNKGGGVAIYTKCKCNVNLVLSESFSKQLEFLALNIEVSKDHHIMVVGCYRPPSAISNSLSTPVNLLSQLHYNEIVVVGDLNWDWLMPVSDALKAQCDSLSLTQTINSLTRPNPRCPEKSSLINLVFTNDPF